MADTRRWKDKRICISHVVEWLGNSVKDVDKAFRNTAWDAGLDADVTPHVINHMSMQRGMSKEDAASFYGTTMETIERHYWHHPDFQCS